MNYSWLMLDADGTLFDYDRAETLALSRSFEDLGLAFDPGYVPIYRDINDRLWKEFERGEVTQARLRIKRFEQLAEALRLDVDLPALSRRYLIRLAEGTVLIEGAEALLGTLHGRVGLLLITNGLTEVQRPRLMRSTIGHYFSHLIISEEVGAAKPHRPIFDVAFSYMSHPLREEVLIVGDSLTSDIQGGSDYGIDTCWYNPARRPLPSNMQVTHQIHSLAQLLPIVGLNGTGSGCGEGAPA